MKGLGWLSSVNSVRDFALSRERAREGAGIVWQREGAVTTGGRAGTSRHGRQRRSADQHLKYLGPNNIMERAGRKRDFLSPLGNKKILFNDDYC